MAIPTSVNTGDQDGSSKLFTWTLTTADATGDMIEWAQWADRTFQASGTWGAGTLTAQGSNDGTNWVTLNNAAGGTPATFTADGGKAVIELYRYARPVLTGSTGATVTVTLHVRRAQPMRT